MRKMTKMISVITVLACAAAMLTSCSLNAPKLEDAAISHETELGGVYIKATTDEFNGLGFIYGDSVKIEFSNGYTLEEVPYYNGFYNQKGDPLLIAYPGYDYVMAVINAGEDLWEVADLSYSDTATVTRVQSGTYLEKQEARDMSYEDDRAKYPSDEAFANFRNIKFGTVAENRLYRSASPCDNQHGRAGTVDDLMEAAGVAYIIDLADTAQKIDGYIAAEDFESDYFLSLYNDGKVLPVGLGMNYSSDEFRSRIIGTLRVMTQREGPYLIQCTDGTDKTGFMCILLDAFVGATYDEIVGDYMLTYENYYGITKESDPDRYNLIFSDVLYPMIEVVLGGDIENADIQSRAESYMIDAGMSAVELEALRTCLTK